MKRWIPALLALAIHAGITTVLVVGAIPMPDLTLLPPETTALPPRLWSFKTEAVDGLIVELKTEREKLESERKGLVTERSQLAAERAEIEKVRAEIQSLRDEIGERIVEIETSELQNLKTLSQTYSAMNPPAVVAIFREMEENMAVKILALMKADRVGPILGEMTKSPDKAGEDSMAKRAARISDKLRLLKPIKKSA